MKRKKKTRVEPLPSAAASMERVEIWGGALALAALVVYILTLFPTVSGGDSGELITAAYTLGIAHPPGYPLFTMLGKIFSLLPFGTVAWRIGLMSAVFDSAAVGLLFAAITRWTKDPWAGLTGAGLLAFSPLIWTYATAAEVFAMNNFFLGALFYLLVRHHESPSIRKVYLCALILGLGLSNHHTFVLFAFPALVVSIWTQRREFLSPAPILRLAGFLLLGLSPYLYLPLAASRRPVARWGDPRTLSGFLRHVTRKDYGTLNLSNPLEMKLQGVKHFGDGIIQYLAGLPRQTLYVGLALALFGVFRGMRTKAQRRILWGLVAVFCLYHFIFELKGNIPLDTDVRLAVFSRFWQEPNFLIYIWCGLGFSCLREILPAMGRRALPGLAVLLVILQIAVGFNAQDQSGNWTFLRFGAALLQSHPKGAVYLVRGDLPNHLVSYVKYCEGIRPDVMVVNRPLMTYDWMKDVIEASSPGLVVPDGALTLTNGPGYTIKSFLDNNLDRFPIFASSFSEGVDDVDSWRDSYSLVPEGFTNRFVRKGEEGGYAHSSLDALLEMKRLFNPDDFQAYAHGAWESLALEDYWSKVLYTASVALQTEPGHLRDPRLDAHLASVLEKLEGPGAVSHPIYYKYLAVAYTNLYGSEPSVLGNAITAWKKYLASNPTDDRDLGRIRQFVSSHQRELSSTPTRGQ